MKIDLEKFDKYFKRIKEERPIQAISESEEIYLIEDQFYFAIIINKIDRPHYKEQKGQMTLNFFFEEEGGGDPFPQIDEAPEENLMEQYLYIANNFKVS